MTYSIMLLTTTDDCDAVLSDTQFQLRLLTHQAEDLAIDTTTSSRGVVSIEVELAKTASEIDSLTRIVPTITDSALKKENEAKLRRAINRQADLQERRETRGGIAQLVRELAQSRVQVQMTEITAFLAAVTAHRATL
jgi:hypothetical protein